ncbi:MAG: patatin-like phospholipase family protein [Cyanobacteria bacterium SZAS-4]|nr:patatin-like phospholipase family protein [Cyanobacteria bacterium SZAS-4]
MWNQTKPLIVIVASLVGLLSGSASFAEQVDEKPISSEEYLIEQSQPSQISRAFQINQNRLLAQSQTGAKTIALTSQQHRPRVALVLGGGGLRGAAHVGVLRVLEREKIPIDMVVGTSMGAIIGGLYCSGVPTEKLEKVLVPGFISSFFESPLLVRALKINTGLLFLQKPEGIYNGKNLARCIERHIPEERREMSNFQPQFGAVTTDLVTGKTVVLTKGDLARALQATAAVPCFRGPVKIENSVLVDGGITCNLPVEQARQLGADFVIAVDVDEKIETTTAKSFHRNVGKIGSRVLSIMLAKIDETQKAQANLSIQPDVTGISLLSKKVADGNRAMSAGETAAKEALPELKLKLTLAGVDFGNKNNEEDLSETELANAQSPNGGQLFTNTSWHSSALQY